MTAPPAPSPVRVERVAIALLFTYLCLLAVQWSPLPFNVQWADVLFPALLVFTIAARPRFRLARLDILVLVYLGSSLLSLLGTTDLRFGILQFVKQGYLALLYAVLAMLTCRLVPPARLARWLAGVAAVVATACVLALAAFYLAGIAVPRLGVVVPLPYLGQIYRLYGAFPSAEYLVNFLAFATPLVIAQALVSGATRQRALWAAAVVAILVAALSTAGHGNVGLAAGATLGVARVWRRRRPRLVATAALVTVAAFLVVNALLVVAVRDVRIVTSRDMAIGEPGSAHVFHDQEAGAPRVSVDLTYNFMGYWLLKQLAWDTFLENPLRGAGLGSFHEVTSRAATEGRIVSGHREHDPHSTWLGRLAETGLIGTVALALLWVAMLRHAYQAAAPGRREADVAAALATGLVAVLVNSPNVDMMNFRFIWVAFGALRGISDRV